MKHMQPQASAPRAAPIDIRTLLVKDHACLEQLFAELGAAFGTGDRDRCAALWNDFDSTLEAHLALEERLILPELAKVDPVEAAALGREHAAIRISLGELGLGVDLHRTNAEAVARFIRVLEEHAKREDALMYRWANTHLQQGAKSTIREQLSAAFRKLAARQF